MTATRDFGVCRELELRGLRFQAEVPVPVTYRGLTIPTAYRMDLLVEDVVIVETKALSRNDRES